MGKKFKAKIYVYKCFKFEIFPPFSLSGHVFVLSYLSNLFFSQIKVFPDAIIPAHGDEEYYAAHNQSNSHNKNLTPQLLLDLFATNHTRSALIDTSVQRKEIRGAYSATLVLFFDLFEQFQELLRFLLGKKFLTRNKGRMNIFRTSKSF